ncbi:hypothetical protein HNP49_002277 [Pseudomonas fluvialis]|uniref:DUF2066 domain-containing protein n=1 Tax=Pseudomonas fluvialis TaxID=1793966 RepID=A0A7X0EUG2_9PSED|nr:DUF2066 domain-containing protein [Pseudomonas fluvialis]MBB6342109.1 hypothetical protein [Pseudomonas fluvialis]
MRAVFRPFLLCLALLAPAAWAQTVTDLYQVREAVSGQQPEERSAALTRALDTLVLRLTGSVAAVQNPGLAELRKNPQQVISQYGYEADALLVQFDPVSTDAALQRAGLSLWGANRPAIIAWWFDESVESNNLLTDGQEGGALVKRAAQHRGLPIRLPIGDLNEQLIVTSESLREEVPAELAKASERYSTDATLAVLTRSEYAGMKAEWTLWLGDTREQGNASAADPAQLADAVLLAVSERLAPRFVVAPGAARSLTLEVEGADLARYAELQRLLEPFAAQLVKADGGRLTFRVSASAEQLRAQLALAHLQESPAVSAEAAPAAPGQAPVVAAQATDTLRFHW